MSKRERLCGVVAVSPHASIEIRALDDGNHARTLGILQCNHVWTCPTCSAAIRAERAERIRLAIEGSGRTWRMLTVTFRHHDGERLARLYAGSTAAWRETRQGGAVQRIWSEKVIASARATEVTFSWENGWHVHFHVLLCLAADFTEEDNEALYARWCAQVAKHLGRGHEPARAHGLYWSRAHDGGIAAYVAKLGMEIAGYRKKAGDCSMTPWELAEEGVKGNARAQELWEEFQRATRGRRAIEMDERAKAFAEEGQRLALIAEEDAAKARGERCPDDDDYERKEAVQLVLFPEEVQALRVGERVSPGYAWHLLRALEQTDDHEGTLRRATTFALTHGGKLRDLDSYLARFEVRELVTEHATLTLAADRRPDPYARPAPPPTATAPPAGPPLVPPEQTALPWVA